MYYNFLKNKISSRKNKHIKGILLRDCEISAVDTLKLAIIRTENDLEIIEYPKSAMN